MRLILLAALVQMLLMTVFFTLWTFASIYAALAAGWGLVGAGVLAVLLGRWRVRIVKAP